MNRPGLMIVFVGVVVVNTLAVDELAELLGQLRTSDLSSLLNQNSGWKLRKENMTFQNYLFHLFLC